MNTSPVVVLTSLAALASAAGGGMMYVFSTMVMRGLDRTGPVDALTAMRGINAEANASPAFLLGYFSATILALVVGVIAVSRLNQTGSWWVLIGAIFAILGAIITMAFNVPLNNHLDTLNPGGLSVADAAREWQAYMSTWTAWNHVRTATAFIGAALMMVGLRYR
ncbi:putative integral membrane protein [Mycobacterium sp. JS623]|uniref:anthrone oxygenase family protein n=1 Tax=Mycobacterium sp. JS623 TaxID=212767 RepID=UPI0002A560AE|nr:anthrone oxygenase family protein [Mycobacterium sp. JS623]AGB26175.1 putative integral membrane protein [Mycobacterium sp. JS623]